MTTEGMTSLEVRLQEKVTEQEKELAQLRTLLKAEKALLVEEKALTRAADDRSSSLQDWAIKQGDRIHVLSTESARYKEALRAALEELERCPL